MDRYASGDHIEKWLNELLCLDASNIPRIPSGYPAPQQCELYPFIVTLPLKKEFIFLSIKTTLFVIYKKFRINLENFSLIKILPEYFLAFKFFW